MTLTKDDFPVGTRVRLDDSGHWSDYAAGKTATVTKVTPEGQVTLDVDDENFHQWTRVDNTHFTVLSTEPTGPDLAASIRARVVVLTDELDAVYAALTEASAKRDTLRQDIAALKNAAARLEAQK